MNHEPSILIVDTDVAFATMLQESLEQDGAYRAIVVTNQDEALEALDEADMQLAIVDLGLADPDGATLARSLRQHQPDLRLILIPLMGEEIPPELADLPVQGLLPKPFFLPELPGRIADALAQPLGEPPVEIVEERLVVGEDARLADLQERMPDMVHNMAVLAQDIHATAVILTCGETLVAYTGQITAALAQELAQAVAESWSISARVAEILGREHRHFEQSVEGGEHIFYSLSVSEDIILSAALRVDVPLGMIRHRTKATAEVLRALLDTSQ